MVRLVDDLLDMARLSEGKVELRPVAVRLDEVVQDAIEISMPLVNGGDHRLTVSLPDAPVVLHVDRHRIAQVLSNLLNNAAKYTPRGGRIDVAGHVEGGQVLISVADNGIGIGADMLPVVFGMYAQVHHDTGMAQGGLGVGLNLVKRLVELHGGRVAAQSGGAGQGSRFTVYLPLAQQPAATQPAAAAVAAAAAADVAPDTDSLRILVVDDNVDAAQMLGELLDMSGHAVQLAHDGAAALAQAPAFRPHVVFLDIGLPDQSGIDVGLALRRLEADGSMARTMLVALTGWGAEQDRQRSSDAGFDAHLTKPADFGHVQALLATVATGR
jgi:CheY-like chemotaxis protein/anti-sigma regulatory factor (Ser/Thr protein kinase)